MKGEARRSRRARCLEPALDPGVHVHRCRAHVTHVSALPYMRDALLIGDSLELSRLRATGTRSMGLSVQNTPRRVARAWA